MTEKFIELYLKETKEIVDMFPIKDITKLVNIIWDCYVYDGTVYIFANGGACGTAEGFATDLKIHPFVSESKTESSDVRRLKVHCLNESSGVITGISNDLGYPHVFSEQLKNYMRNKEKNKYDVVIGFSGSGNSENILNAFRYAKIFGCRTVCITGRGGGKAKEVADICIIIPGTSTFPGQTGKNDNNFHIEDFQVSISHMVTGIIKKRITGW